MLAVSVLMVDGDTIIPNSVTLAGAWVLTNDNQSLVSLFINLGSAFVFDAIEGLGPNDGTGPGRDGTNLVSTLPIGYSFTGLVQDGLFSGLELFDIALGQTQFAMDTDSVTAVPAPAALSLIGLTLLGLTARSRRKQA